MARDDELRELRGKLNDRREKAAQILSEAGDDLDMDKVKSIEGDSKAKVEAFQKLQAEMSDLAKQVEEKEAENSALPSLRDQMAQFNETRSVPVPSGKRSDRKEAPEVKSLGDLFAESGLKKVAEGHMGPEAEFDNVDIKATLFSTGAGWAPPTVRSDRVVDYAVRPNVLANLLPTINVSLPTYLYMEETTFTNSAAEVAEGSSKPESALALTQRTETIRKIATYLPVTDEQLEDVDAARNYIDNRLGYMVAQRLDTQIVAGDGTGNNILGINHAGRSAVQQQAKGADPTPDAVYKAMTLIRTNAFSEPNGAVFHPLDWQDIRLLRTADGIYIWGNPADAGPERIWGLTVVQTTGMTQNTALVGDFNQAALLLRQGLTMKVGYVNDDLIKNRQTIVAEMRAAVAVFRPAAFCEVTGI